MAAGIYEVTFDTRFNIKGDNHCWERQSVKVTADSAMSAIDKARDYYESDFSEEDENGKPLKKPEKVYAEVELREVKLLAEADI